MSRPAPTPTPAELARYDQADARNDRILLRETRRIRAALDAGTPRWQIADEACASFHALGPQEQCTLAQTAVILLAQHLPDPPAPELARDHVVRHGDVTDRGLTSDGGTTP